MTELSVLSIGFAVTSAIFFGSSTIITRRGLYHMDAQTGSMISIGTTVLFYLVLSPFWMHAEDWFSPGFWVFGANGFIHPLFSMFFSFQANRRIGPTISSTFCATSPFFATIIAVLVLGESLTPTIVIGTLLTVFGVMVLSWNRQGVTTIVKSALLLATGAAVIRGLNHNIGRIGMKLMPNASMAGFISFAVAFCSAVLWYRFSKGYLPIPTRIHRKGLYIFALTGVANAIAIWCMYAALGTGLVVMVSPIVAAYPMFAMLTAVIFRQEMITRRIVTGVFIVIGGAALISMGAAR